MQVWCLWFLFVDATFYITKAISKPQDHMRDAEQLLTVKVLFFKENSLFVKRSSG
jgi:hypothetical protein